MILPAVAERHQILQLLQEVKVGHARDEGAVANAIKIAFEDLARRIQQRDRQLPADAIARRDDEKVTSKQLIAIRAIARARGLKADQVCMELLKCRPELLSRSAASVLMEVLKTQ